MCTFSIGLLVIFRGLGLFEHEIIATITILPRFDIHSSFCFRHQPNTTVTPLKRHWGELVDLPYGPLIILIRPLDSPFKGLSHKNRISLGLNYHRPTSLIRAHEPALVGQRYGLGPVLEPFLGLGVTNGSAWPLKCNWVK